MKQSVFKMANWTGLCHSLFVLCLVALTLPVYGQTAPAPATLVADSIVVDPAGTLTAEGDVEVFYDGQTLRAGAVVYDRNSDTIRIEGPIQISAGPGFVLIASEAELASDLRSGVLQSARLVLEQQLQMAAVEAQRVDGRYTQLYRAVASSCEVCKDRPIPIWQIRATRIVHDQVERQIYFDNALFEIMGVPVFYLPRLRVPDPTLERATGFLFPSFRTTGSLGFGIELPYFIDIAPDKDLTLRPQITTKDSRTLGVRYRQLFTFGDLLFDGAFTRDQLIEGDRGYATLLAGFTFGQDYRLTFDLETVSDEAYYRDYGFDDVDRFDSDVEVSRTRRDKLSRGTASYFTTFREDEDNDTIPRYVLDGEIVRRFDTPELGGVAELEFSFLSLTRPSSENEIGRDTDRLSAILDWRRSWTNKHGMVGTAITEFALDSFHIQQDTNYPDSERRLSATLAAEWRWPFLRARNGSTTMIEPIAQLVWSEVPSVNVPNEDSTEAEFDEASLFDLNRFAGRDQIESGLRANVGVTYSHFDQSGWNTDITVGRIFRDGENAALAPGASPDDRASDWLTTFQTTSPLGLQVINRAQFSSDLSINKNAFRLGWYSGEDSLNMTYTWLRASEAEFRPTDTNELVFATTRRLDSNWIGGLNYTYDFDASKSRDAELILQYSNECIVVDLTVSQNFTDSTQLRSTTDFGIEVSLAGFGTGQPSNGARACRG